MPCILNKVEFVLTPYAKYINIFCSRSQKPISHDWSCLNNHNSNYLLVYHQRRHFHINFKQTSQPKENLTAVSHNAQQGYGLNQHIGDAECVIKRRTTQQPNKSHASIMVGGQIQPQVETHQNSWSKWTGHRTLQSCLPCNCVTSNRQASSHICEDICWVLDVPLKS